MGAPAYAKRGKVRPIKPTDSVRGAIRWLPSKRVRRRTVPRGFRACGKVVKKCGVGAATRLAASGRRREPQSRAVFCGLAGQGTSHTLEQSWGGLLSWKERALASSHYAECGRVSLSGVLLSRLPMNSSPEEGTTKKPAAERPTAGHLGDDSALSDWCTASEAARSGICACQVLRIAEAAASGNRGRFAFRSLPSR
jgi:hypothetical protein